MIDSFDLSGKVALVTGARRGIGLAMAQALASAGADIIAVSASMEPTGSAVEAAVHAHGRAIRTIACDFADAAAVASLGAQLAREDPIDILVNNAGTIYREPAVDHDLDQWSRLGQGHLHRVTAQFPGRHQCPRLHRVQERCSRVDPGVGERVGPPWGHRQRDRTGVHRHRQHPGAPGRPGASGQHRRAYPGGAMGPTR